MSTRPSLSTPSFGNFPDTHSTNTFNKQSAFIKASEYTNLQDAPEISQSQNHMNIQTETEEPADHHHIQNNQDNIKNQSNHNPILPLIMPINVFVTW